MLSEEGFLRLQVQGSSCAGRNGCGGREDSFVAKEHMFDKVVTPSDVGKLNRLVIPKQYAEKYLPLDTAEAVEKGLLLSFEDRAGKSWRFRYSYWSSSQSYVMTKGWSRFVREKGLDAGDTVYFGRGVGSDGARPHLYIDWKRRCPENGGDRRHPLQGLSAAYPPTPVGFFVPPRGHNNWRVRPPLAISDAGSASRKLEHFRLPVVCEQAAAAKRVRLFGVNLDSPPQEGGHAIDRSFRSVSSARSHGGDDETPARKEMESTLDLCL